MNDEQWAVVLLYSDGKSPNAIDSSLRFASRKFADRAVAKLTEEIATKGLSGMTLLGPVQVAGPGGGDVARAIGAGQAAGASETTAASQPGVSRGARQAVGTVRY